MLLPYQWILLKVVMQITLAEMNLSYLSQVSPLYQVVAYRGATRVLLVVEVAAMLGQLALCDLHLYQYHAPTRPVPLVPPDPRAPRLDHPPSAPHFAQPLLLFTTMPLLFSLLYFQI